MPPAQASLAASLPMRTISSSVNGPLRCMSGADSKALS